MSLLDFSKNCDIITSSFVDDLQPYTLTENNTIMWSDITTDNTTSYTIKNDLFISNDSDPMYWTPNFVTDDSLIDNKIISHYGSVKGDSQFTSGRIGIEDFITFTPRFKNWTITNGNMIIDWILNRSRSPYSVMYGLNYWKINSTPVTGPIEIFPPYAKIKHNNIEYIKLDNSTLRRLNVKQNVFGTLNNIANSSPINFNYTDNDADTLVSSLGNNVRFTLVGSDNVKVWIPDGNQLLYFSNISEKNKNLRENIGPRSYVSGSLYKYYNMFYNSLTANEIITNINNIRSVRKLRLYKKLAHSLATSPFSSEFFYSFLAKPSSTIKDAINTYLNSDSSDINSDINNLTTVLNSISNEYSAYEINNNNNIVKNNNELFIKLINKYGAKLKLSGSSSVSYNKNLTYGDSVLIEEIGDSLVAKNTANVLVTNNKKINLNNLVLETNFGETISSILLKKKTGNTEEILNTAYLYDIVKPNILNDSNINILMEKNNNVKEEFKFASSSRIPILNDNVFYWGAGRIQDSMRDWLFYCPKLKIINLNLLNKHVDSRFPNQGKELAESEFFCSWEKVSGPTMKFVDLSKTQTNKNYNKAYGNEVLIVPYSTGKYVIKCVVSSPFGSYTKFKTIFIVDGREKLGDQPNTQFNTYSSIDNPDILFLSDSFRLGSDGLNNWQSTLSTEKGAARVTLTELEKNKYSSEAIPINLNIDNIQTCIFGLDSLAIHRNGLFSPIRTNYYVERVSSSNRSIEKLNTNYSFMFDKDNSGSIVPKLNNSTLKIDYLCNQTIIKLDRIILRNIRNETPQCSQCYSLYKPKFKSFINSSNRRPSFQRSNKFNDGFTLQRYINDGPNKFNKFLLEEYRYPQISNDLAPPIKTYGGYGNKVLDKLTINNISSHDQPESANNQIVASQPFVIPSVTGYKLDYTDTYTLDTDTVKRYKICYQNSVAPNGFIPFSKGAFVPNSGWVVGDSRNLSSVLKFNPGARKSFSFSGPGILGLNNYTNDDSLAANVFKSTIQLGIDPSSMWWSGPNVDGRGTGGGPEAQRAIREAKKQHNFVNQINRELADQYIGGANNYHHGYRILNGGNPKLPERNLVQNSTPKNDEFNLSIDETSNKFIYNFTVVGPNNPINFSEQDLDFVKKEYPNIMGDQPIGEGPEDSDQNNDDSDYIDNGGWNLRNPRINNLKIKDIEVKLNFLNYVNTKNLAIWLEVEFSSSEKKIMELIVDPGGPIASPQISAPNIFKDQYISNNTYKEFDGIRSSFVTSDNIPINNSSIKNYLKNLTNTNSRNSVGEKLILYLLNQETIQNKEYNFSVKFSDTANKHNVFFDQNMFSNGSVNADQNIISNNMSINPSKNSFNYNTYLNSNFSNIVKLNNLNINNNTFQKFSDRNLFLGLHPNQPSVPIFGPYTESTKFTLHIAVLEEEDEMFPMDNIINNDIYTNLASIENKISSANLFNNLCSWELILHTEDVKKPVTSQVNSLASYGGADSLGVLEYGEDPKYPGYGFIADLSDSKFLLPLVNMNSPTNYYQNYNSCEYADNELIGKGSLINSPRFPSEAILFILAGTAVGGMTGTLVGALVGGLGPTYSLGFQLLLDYYKESRAIPILELTQRETFDIDYEGYPFGNSDKILLNISKDGIFWYKVEASIFKLSNTPALPPKEYSLIPKNSSLFKFEFSTITNNSDIIDDIFIPYIISKATPEITNDPPTDEELELVNSYKDINNSVYNSFDFTTVNELVYFNKLIIGKNNVQQDIFSRRSRGDSLVIIDNLLLFYLIDIDDVLDLDCSLEISEEDEDSPPPVPPRPTVTSKALVYKDNRYQTVLALNTSDEELSNCSTIILPSNVIAFADNNYATKHFGDSLSPISSFGLVNNQPPYDTIPDLNFSTNSLGSYGDGSSVKDKNILSRKVQINTIEQFSNQFNSFDNDKYYFNELIFKDANNNTTKIKAKFVSYPVYYDQDLNRILNNNFYHLYDKGFTNIESDLNQEQLQDLLDNINTSIKNYRSYTKDQKSNMVFLKLQSIRDGSIVPSVSTLSKYIGIENNYSYNETIHRITTTELDILKARLDILNVTENISLDPIIGVSNRTTTVLNSNSISYIQQHYDILDIDDHNKTISYNKLQKLYSERNEILQLLQHQTIIKAKIFRTKTDFEAETPVFIEGNILYDSLKYIQLNNGNRLDKENLYKIEYNYTLDPAAQKYHTGNGGIIPDFRAIIKQETIGPNSGAISINYEKMSDNYYWINIDPKQSTSIAEESRPRILKSIKYICQSTNPSFSAVGAGAEILDFNNICPDWKDIDGKTTDNIKIQADSTGTSYIMHDKDFGQQVLTNKKNTWGESVSAWREQVISRRFRINSDNNIKGSPNQEYLVTAIETYEIGLTPIEAEIQSARSEGQNDDQIIASLLTKGLIKNDYSGDILKKGLLNGLGEPPGDTDRDSTRTGFPTRVYNIFNLDNTDQLKVQFRKAPRALRGIDAIGSVLRYGEATTYKPQNRPPLDPLDIFGIGRTESLINNFYEWKCLQLNKDREGLEEAPTPDFFKLLNEMVFRAFFGSVDEIENKTPRLKSLYDFEMIPYEYFTKPQPPPNS